MIRSIEKPTVTMIARTKFMTAAAMGVALDYGDSRDDARGFAEPPSDPKDSAVSTKLIEFSGRVCYRSFGAARGRKSHEDYVAHILGVKHETLLEHVSCTFHLAGVSRTLTHELVRHRIGFSYSQESQRYVDASEAAFVVPPAILESASTAARFAWETSCERALDDYKAAIAFGEAEPAIPGETKTERTKRVRQTARAVLPGCIETRIVVTGNLRAWRHFLHLRGSRAADAEIRRLAVEVAKQLIEVFPAAFQDVALTNYGGVKVGRDA